MKHIFWLSCLLYITSATGLRAQDQANFTQFYLNPYLINPSYAGIDGQSALSVIYRRQWMNIDGGPSIANFSLQGPIGPSAGFGLSVTNDKKGLLTNSALRISFAYNALLGDHTSIRLGLSGGGSWNSLDLQALNQNDPAIANVLDNHASITGNAGISFHHKTFHFGASMPTIFSPSYVSTDAFTITEVKPFQSIIVNASNRFYFNNNKNVFEPYAIYRMNTDLPSQFEFAGIVHLNHTIWLGGSYKQDFGISALGGIKLNNLFAIGASYSLANSGINELNSPTFEVSLTLLLGQRKKGVHAYSFVNTVKEKEKKATGKSASEAIAEKRKLEEAERKKQLEAQAKAREEEAKRKQQEQAKAAADRQAKIEADKKAAAQAEADRKAKVEADRKAALAQAEANKKQPEKTPDVVKPPVTQQTTTVTERPVVKNDSVPRKHNPRLRQEMVETIISVEDLPHDETETLKRLEVHADNPTEHHQEPPSAHPNAERHEFVKRGSHKEELDVADYVIGGVFKSDANAKHFADGLIKLGFKADYGHLTEKNLWYVYLYQTTDINLARNERDRVRKMLILRDAWLLTVHH
ncbi:MAG TPA: PorP/SprF family type IX secretion system membrane protein [Chryseosolibacter sp.]